MERDKLLAALRELSDRGHGAAGFKPLYVIEQEILAEFDRLNEIITNQSSLINNMGKRGATLQSHLDNISEPIKKAAATSYTLNRWARECENERCHYIPDILKAIASYLDSQKASERPPVYLFDSHLAMVEGKLTRHSGDAHDCPICNPKDHTAECAKILKMPPAEVEWLKKIEIEEAEPKCEHKNLGLLALGGTQRCLDCHEWIIAKPFTQCPDRGCGDCQYDCDYCPNMIFPFWTQVHGKNLIAKYFGE